MPEDYQQQNVDPTRRMDQDFSREEWRFKSKIISSESAPENIITIINSPFSQAYKQALSQIIKVSFDPNVVLARNENVNIRILKLRIELNLSVATQSVSLDSTNTADLITHSAIEDGFADFVSRSAGGKERDAITKSETVGTQHYTGLNQPQEQKRGLEIPWRRNRV